MASETSDPGRGVPWLRTAARVAATLTLLLVGLLIAALIAGAARQATAQQRAANAVSRRILAAPSTAAAAGPDPRTSPARAPVASFPPAEKVFLVRSQTAADLIGPWQRAIEALAEANGQPAYSVVVIVVADHAERDWARQALDRQSNDRIAAGLPPLEIRDLTVR